VSVTEASSISISAPSETISAGGSDVSVAIAELCVVDNTSDVTDVDPDGPDGAEAVAPSCTVLSPARLRLSAATDGGMRYHSDTVTEAGHFLASSSRSRSDSGMHSLKARRSVIGPRSSGRRRGSALKHDSTFTDRFDTKERTSSTP